MLYVYRPCRPAPSGLCYNEAELEKLTDTRLPMTALSRFRVLNTGPTTKAEDKARAAGQGWS